MQSQIGSAQHAVSAQCTSCRKPCRSMLPTLPILQDWPSSSGGTALSKTGVQVCKGKMGIHYKWLHMLCVGHLAESHDKIKQHGAVCVLLPLLIELAARCRVAEVEGLSRIRCKTLLSPEIFV